LLYLDDLDRVNGEGLFCELCGTCACGKLPNDCGTLSFDRLGDVSGTLCAGTLLCWSAATVPCGSLAGSIAHPASVAATEAVTTSAFTPPSALLFLLFFTATSLSPI
jgi:hypothetical protein